MTNPTLLQSYREKDVVLNENAPTEIYFVDTEPNHINFSNNTSSTIYVSESSVVSPTTHDIQIPSGGTKMYAKPKGMKRVFVYHSSTSMDTIHVVSFVDTFTPQSLAQTQETVNTQQMTGDVGVTSLPPLVAGNALIGKVDLNTAPDIDRVAYTIQQVTMGAAGDTIVKNAAGKVAGIRAAGTVNVILKNAASQIWDTIAGGSEVMFPVPVSCPNNITLNFSAAGTAYIIYK